MATEIEIFEINEPLLEFGGPGEFTDPKEGLKHGGPFDLRFGTARKTQINIGFIGEQEMILKAKSWLKRCEGIIPSEMPNLVQYPYYLGFKKIFHADLNYNPLWERIIDKTLVDLVLSQRNKPDIFKRTLSLFEERLQDLAKIETVKPDVIFCCISKEIIEKCWSIKNDMVKASDLKKVKRLNSQLSLFEEADAKEPIEEQEEDILNRDFRRALKARAMLHGIPIQIGTDNLFVDSSKNQDASIRAWNSSIAIYYKAGGIPWRLRRNSVETCYVGISFHHLYTTHDKHLVRSCIAQAFSSDGEGFAIRGVNIPWTEDQGRDVHLTEQQSFQLGEKILEEYRYRTGATPLKVVLHKSTAFNEDESNGLRSALNNVPIVELVNIAPTEFRLVRFGEYPPKRGTLCIVNNSAKFLFTTGFMPELKTYPGPHVPVPIRINTDSDDILATATDIMALARMNWNTASTTGGHPVTLLFSRRVGGIMAEYGDSEPPSSFKFYL
ncbi:MAG: argonaute/piwi family protein [Agriterribacter sp.]